MKIKVLIPLIVALSIYSCEKEDLNEKRSARLLFFNKVELNSSFEVYLKEDSIFSIEIVGHEKVIEDVDYYIEDSILKIRNNSKYKWTKPSKNRVRLYLSSTGLKELHANETSKIETINPITSDEFGLILKNKTNEATLDLDCRAFYYWNNFPCGGRLTLRGNVEELKIWNFAIMSVDAKDLTANYAIVENSSKGDIWVNVIEKFEYSIKGTGDIHLLGNPPLIIENEKMSSGKLIEH